MIFDERQLARVLRREALIATKAARPTPLRHVVARSARQLSTFLADRDDCPDMDRRSIVDPHGIVLATACNGTHRLTAAGKQLLADSARLRVVRPG